jgi:hypothetical protein
MLRLDQRSHIFVALCCTDDALLRRRRIRHGSAMHRRSTSAQVFLVV